MDYSQVNVSPGSVFSPMRAHTHPWWFFPPPLMVSALYSLMTAPGEPSGNPWSSLPVQLPPSGHSVLQIPVPQSLHHCLLSLSGTLWDPVWVSLPAQQPGHGKGLLRDHCLLSGLWTAVFHPVQCLTCSVQESMSGSSHSVSTRGGVLYSEP